MELLNWFHSKEQNALPLRLGVLSMNEDSIALALTHNLTPRGVFLIEEELHRRGAA